MAIYRALRRLSGVCEAGALTRLEWLAAEQIGTLLGVGAVARVSAPRLDAVPGWEARALLLEAEGIADAEALIEADASALAEALEMDADEISLWQGEAQALLVLPTEDDGCDCYNPLSG